MTSTPKSDSEMRAICNDVNRLLAWALYENPADYPGKWVVRLFVCDQGAEAKATTFCFVGDFKDEVVAAIPGIDKRRWSFIPEYDPSNPQIVGAYI